MLLPLALQAAEERSKLVATARNLLAEKSKRLCLVEPCFALLGDERGDGFVLSLAGVTDVAHEGAALDVGALRVQELQAVASEEIAQRPDMMKIHVLVIDRVEQRLAVYVEQVPDFEDEVSRSARAASGPR